MTNSIYRGFSGGVALPPKDYQALLGVEKAAYLQSLVEQSRYRPSELPAMEGHSVSDLLTRPFQFRRAFKEESDFRTEAEQAKKTRKFFHTFGVEGRGFFDPNPKSGLTGLFQGGAVFMRLSQGWPNTNAPGLGVKFFVDGQPSRNIFMLGFGEDANIVKTRMSNVIDHPKNAVAKWFADQTLGRLARDPFHMPLDEISRVRSDGTSVSAPEIPYEIYTRPTQLAEDLFSGTEAATDEDFRKLVMERIDRREPLFELWVRFPALFGAVFSNPETGHPNLGQEVFAGTLWTGGEGLNASEFGEYGLLFQHPQR